MTAGSLLALARPFTVLAPLVGTAAGALVVVGTGRAAWDWTHVSPALVSAALATVASNAWNQAFDVALDKVNKPGRPVPAGRVSVRQALGVGHAAALLALATGLLASTGFFLCVTAGLLATWIYSAPPLRAKRHLLGALVAIAFARGLLVPVAGWAVLSPVDVFEPWALGLVVALFVLGAAATKDFADIEGDRANGCRTLPVVLGPARAARAIAPFLVLPFALYPLLGAAGILSPPVLRLVWLAVVLVLGGVLTAWCLLRDPSGLAASGRNHLAWVAMYLLMLAAHVGTACVYIL